MNQLLILTKTLRGRICFCVQIKNGEIWDTEGFNDSPKVTQLISGKDKILAFLYPESDFGYFMLFWEMFLAAF